MKRIISLLMIFVIISLTLVSCVKTEGGINHSVNTNGGDTEKNNETLSENDETESKESDNIADITENGIVAPNGGEGETGKLYYSYHLDSIPSEIFVDGDTELSAMLPVYTYRYGYGQGGPLYINNEDLVAEIEDKLRDFVAVLYDEKVASEAEVTTVDYADYFDYSDLPYSLRINTSLGEISARSDQIAITLSETIDEHSIAEGLEANDIFSACFEYMNFSSPKMVVESKDNRNYYTVYNMEIEGSVFDSSSSLQYISFISNKDGRIRTIHMTGIQFTEKYGEYQTISYDTALGMVKEEYPEIDPDKVSAVRIWKYGFDQDPLGTESKGMGYYFPCYRFYIQDPTGDSEGVDMVDVSMTTFDITDFYE